MLLGLISVELSAQELFEEKKRLVLMGCAFEITAVDHDRQNAWDAINAGIKEIERIENMISSWKEYSQTSKINKQAGISPVKVDQELFDLIYRSKKISKLTLGAFDISFASMESLWKFDKSSQLMPSKAKVEQASSLINWENIELDMEDKTVFLREKGMRIGFGAIGKGYAANMAIQKMKQYCIEGALVNASGDIICWGKNIKSDKWKIMISDPEDPNSPLAWLEIQDQAVVTSGSYEKYAIIEGQRYAHIIDPRSGYPVTGLKSVTIVCPDAELADAFATSVFVLGPEEGLSLINRLKHVECLMITDTNQMLSSNNLQLSNHKKSVENENSSSD